MNCERCGIAKPLVVHHRDRNHGNNDQSNLEILCPNCHYLEHGIGLKIDPTVNYSDKGTMSYAIRVPEPVWDDLVTNGKLRELVQKEIEHAYWQQGYIKREGRWMVP